MVKTEKDLMMMYHTEIRNIGLYTSISLAALAYSRSYRGKGFYRNILGIFLSLAFISFGIIINRYLWLDMIEFVKKIDANLMPKWLQLLPYIGLFQVLIVCLNIYTLYTELTKKK
tara:strand:- start:367 stop:711 length:345 start_codon:yes stop_codon:yes gene_type:complete